MKSKDSNVAAKHVVRFLLLRGFQIALDDSGRLPKATQRNDTRDTRDKLMTPAALTSLSGKSVYLVGENPKTGNTVTIFMQVKNRLSEPALKALVDKTGYALGDLDLVEIIRAAEED